MAEVTVTTESEATTTVRATFSGAATGDPEELKDAFKAFLDDLRGMEDSDATGSIVIGGTSINETDLFPPEEEAPAPAAETKTTSTAAKTSNG